MSAEGRGEGCRNEHEQVQGEHRGYERARGGMNVRGGVGGTNKHGGSAWGMNAGWQWGLRAPRPSLPYHYFFSFIISIFLNIFMYAFRIF